jgi:hypothetical protein
MALVRVESLLYPGNNNLTIEAGTQQTNELVLDAALQSWEFELEQA